MSHEINQFCSKNTLQDVYIDKFDTLDEALIHALDIAIKEWAPGIEIIAVRVTKPQIPAAIARNYEIIEGERTKLRIATQAQKVVARQAETEREKAKIEAEKAAAVAAIENDRQVAEKLGKKEVELINTQMHIDRTKAAADAQYYQVTKEAEGNKAILTPEYVRLEAFKHGVANAKMFFGDAIPTMLMANAASGAAATPAN